MRSASCHAPPVELRAPERPVGDASRRGMADRPTLIFATGPAPLLGALATALLAYRDDVALAGTAFLLVAPALTLVFARRRRVEWSASAGFAFIAVSVASCWIAFLWLCMIWEIGQGWSGIDEFE